MIDDKMKKYKPAAGFNVTGSDQLATSKRSSMPPQIEAKTPTGSMPYPKDQSMEAASASKERTKTLSKKETASPRKEKTKTMDPETRSPSRRSKSSLLDI